MTSPPPGAIFLENLTTAIVWYLHRLLSIRPRKGVSDGDRIGMSIAPLSVLHISRADNSGGAARVAYKIHTGLRETGITSRMLVELKGTGDPDVDYVHSKSLRQRALDFIGRYFVDRIGLQYLYYPSSFALLRHPWVKTADIVQLYNTHGGYFTHRVLPRLSRDRVVVWRLLDMWPLTCHCAYSLECDRWRVGCGSCPRLDEYPGLPWDTTSLLWRIKKSVYDRSRLVLVSDNSWMDEMVTQSPLLSRFPTYRIPTGVDTDIFRPIAKHVARAALGIDPTANVLLFVANVAATGTRKGGEYVLASMKELAASGFRDLVLMVVGEQAESWPSDDSYQTVRLGFANSDRFLALVYSGADVLIYPALAENFPNVILESMACGTPAVAFSTGGIPDMVRHLENGYLANYGDVSDLTSGVRKLLEEAMGKVAMGKRGREIAIAEYSIGLQTQRYAELYRALLSEGPRREDPAASRGLGEIDPTRP